MKLYGVTQHLVSAPLADVASAVRAQLDGLALDVAGKHIAVTVGSRGISNIATLTRAAGDWLRQHGAMPFLVPCMGSHNGATAVGQRAMIESLGITEQAMGMPIRASMEVASLGAVATGEVYMDRHCYESDGVLVLNRVKYHTCFAGPVQSGLMKMMVVGMGKIRSAQTFHSTPSAYMKTMLLEMAEVILGTGKILAGLAVLEDGFDQTAEVHGVLPADILSREPALLARHGHYFPRLPVDALDVLVVDEMGKTYSGTGMDTNVLGRRGVRDHEDLSRPDIGMIAALGLAAASHGNAIGVGLADFITQRLRDAIDEPKTLINVLTTGEMGRAKIPATYADDETLLSVIERRFGGQRWMFIRNTLHLGQLFVTEDLAAELSTHPRCTVDDDPTELVFEGGRMTLLR